MITFVVIYIISALVVGSIHWAVYRDAEEQGRLTSREEKVMDLYVIPLLPVVNTIRVINLLGSWIGLW